MAILHAVPTKFILINAQKLFQIEVHKNKTENISISSIPMLLKVIRLNTNTVFSPIILL